MEQTASSSEIFILVLAVIITLGRAFDAALRKTHKIKLYHWLQDSWLWLDEQEIPDFLSVVAKRNLATIHRFIGKRLFSRKVIIRSFLISTSITSIVLFLGGTFSAIHAVNSLEGLLFSLCGLVLLIPSNYLLDIISCAFTIKIISVLSNRISFLKSSGLIFFDGLIACICASLVVPALFVVYQMHGPFSVELLGENLNTELTEPSIYFDSIENVEDYSLADPKTLVLGFTYYTTNFILYSSTTLFPTLAYLSVLIFLILAKYFLIFFKWITSKYLLLFVDDEPHKLQVGTLTATFLSVLVALGKLMLALLDG